MEFHSTVQRGTKILGKRSKGLCFSKNVEERGIQSELIGSTKQRIFKYLRCFGVH